MNIYLVKREKEWIGYDEFDSFVVVADSCLEALKFHPRGRDASERQWKWEWTNNKENLSVTLIGYALSGMNEGVILASFNADSEKL